MAKKNKIVVFSLITLIIVSCCWLDFVFIKENSQFFAEELQKAGETSDVVIVFNSGGYGTVVPEKLMTLSQLLII